MAHAAAQRGQHLAGLNGYGQLGNGTNTDKNVPTAVSTGSVTTWLAISAGGYYTCGLAAGGGLDGDAYCWGESLPCHAINPAYREVWGLHMQPRRTPLLSVANTSQA